MAGQEATLQDDMDMEDVSIGIADMEVEEEREADIRGSPLHSPEVAKAADGQTKGSRRLMITEMVLENFKSYAGAQRVGPFHKCFSSVVGPNGSGKSNVIDAMLFVFGKRAKQLRLNKVSELIHNSSNHQNLQEARVTVHFNEIVDLDDEAYEVIPNSELTIARSAYRNNTSKYFINGKTSTFTDVTNLLKGKGVDLDNNRFLILQGEVEQIAMMKPKSQGPHDEGLLEYLEDIIGSNCYIEQIENVSKELETLNETRTGMVQRVKLVEKDKDALEGVKKEAEAYILKEAEKLQWQGKVYEIMLHEAESTVESLQKQVAELSERISVEREKAVEYQRSLADMEGSYNKLKQEHEFIQKELEVCQNEFTECERKDVKYREDLKHSKTKLKKLEEKLKKDSAKLEELERGIEKARAALPSLEEAQKKSAQVLVKEESHLEKIQEDVKADVEEYHKHLSKYRVELEPYEKELTDCRARIDIASTKKNLLLDKHKAAARQYEDAQATFEEQKKEMEQKGQELVRIEKEVEKHRRTAAECRDEEQACLLQETGLEAKTQSARALMAEMEEALYSEKTQNSMMQALLQAKQTGQIPGIYGRLGDLGAIDAKYDVAISTACAALDYVVVETTADAKACVEMLRANSLGVATFLILEKQQGLLSAMREKLQAPEGVPRLFDLIRTENEKLLPAFYFALRNTIVAKDLDQATRIAFGTDRRFRRAVTLIGEVIEPSGTMSGGGGRGKGGKMGTAVVKAVGASKESLLQAEERWTSLSEELRQLREKKAQAAEGAKRANESLRALEMRIEKIKIEVEALHIQHAELSNRLPDLKNSANSNREELAHIDGLQAAIAAEEQKKLKIENDSSPLRAKVAEFQTKIEGAGSKVKEKKARVAALQQEIDAAGSESNRMKVLISANAKAMEKVQKAIEDAKLEKETQTQLLEAKKEELKGLEKGAFAVHDNYKRVKELLEAKREELEGIQNQYNKLKATADELRTIEVDTQCKLDDVVRHTKTCQEKKRMLVGKLQDVRKEQQQQLAQLTSDGMDPARVEAAMAAAAMEDISCEEAQQQVALLEKELKEMKPNMAAIAEYRRKEAEYGERVKDLDSLTKQRDQMRRGWEDLRKRRLEEFMAGFNIITMKLKEMYQMITLGGDAELELVDSLDPFSEGIVFSVRPPKKSWKNISNLSGGEKTLSSLALVFALHHYKPTPLYVMDEIDAALDFKNVSIVAHYIKDRTKNAQFIIISLRNNMFELADRLVGIYKTDNCTKSITINPNSFAVASSAS